MSDISTPVIRTLYWKTVAIYPYIIYAGYKNIYAGYKNIYAGYKNIYAGYKNIYAVADNVLITGIHCILYSVIEREINAI